MQQSHQSKGLLTVKPLQVSNISYSKCYILLVRPILECIGTVWSPHLQCQKHQIEKVQCSATRFVTNDFSYYSSVCHHVETPKVTITQTQKKLLKTDYVLQNTIHGLADTSITLLPLLTSTREHNQHFAIPFARTDTSSYLPPLNCGIFCLIHWLNQYWMTLINLELIYPLISSPQTNFMHIIICVLILFCELLHSIAITITIAMQLYGVIQLLALRSVFKG